MRADRLISLLLLLQRQGRVTAAQAAAELEVSPATARRDLEALSSAGVPVYAQPGRGGGWQLLGGARTDLTGLTAGEAQAVFQALGAAALRDADTRGATAKLLRALPAPLRTDATTLAASVHHDRRRWGDPEPPDEDAWVPALRAAIVARRELEVHYRSRGRPAEVRVVRPLALVDKAGAWYLVADDERGRRTYRTSRIEHVEPTGAEFARPGDFDVLDYWRQDTDEVEARRGRVSARVRARADIAGVLTGQFGRYCEAGEPDQTGWVPMVVSAHLPVALAEQLAGWGARVEVVEPDEVRRELARIGAELVGSYGSGT
ncbi:MAG: WYL domain-containing protein [Micropruina sp.]|nr:MAG: WYL domain-containing protein [Micropruina sp.]